eukprot:gnl/MRDRNA2_/MRDRNA2_79311_c0_seq1.p1 gnl/MRDRNA2_/MRDRNA2_79311_c0~~gnl/MRDRNA2_/MRDRNA2_79311_c0_seq1.p1  ORF type:complete len:768 (-),score=126.86 gnl/MRDRNA2_/MRDRNA2_79311_c0_seq1:165-2207(-)
MGAPSQFGGWDVKQALKFRTDPEQYPVWRAHIALPSVSTGHTYEYKLITAADELGQWPECTQDHIIHKLPSQDPGTIQEITGIWNEVHESIQILQEGKEIIETESESGSVSDSGSDCAEDELEGPETPRRRNMRRAKRAGAQGNEDPNGAVKYVSQHLHVPVVIVTPEIDPWSKSCDTAFVAASFAYEFAARGHRTMTVSPMYDDYTNTEFLTSRKLVFHGQEHEVDFFHEYKDFGGFGTDYVFVSHPTYRRTGGFYYDAKGMEYEDNFFRFSLLALAALEAPFIDSSLMPAYGNRVTFLANDWQTGLLPFLISHKYRNNFPDPEYMRARCLYVLHNLGNQGLYSSGDFPPMQVFDLEDDGVVHNIVHDDKLNLTKAAVKCSDMVVTVSPSYAVEITTDDGARRLMSVTDARFSLQEVMEHKYDGDRLKGILNGIVDDWDPSTDPHIAQNYSHLDFEEGKAACKADLQATVELHEDPRWCVIGFMGPLTRQKGVDLLAGVLSWVMKGEGRGSLGRVQLIMMGEGGDRHAMEELKRVELMYPGRAHFHDGYDEKLKHQMMAGCDLLLMPSMYEPCGFLQMYSQLYGTLPIVTDTGGFKDSVKSTKQAGQENATGFKFHPFTEEYFKEEICRAMNMFHNRKEDFIEMQENAMRQRMEFAWPNKIDEYEEAIDEVLDRRPHLC